MLKTRWSPLLLAAILVVSVGLAGCSGGNGSRQAPAGAATDLAKTRPATPELIQMLTDVAADRGLPPPPAIRFGTVRRDALPSLLDSLLTEDDRNTFTTTTTLYRLLGHLRPDQDYLSVYRSLASQSAVGLYSPAHDTLWIVDDRPPSEFTLEGLSGEAKAALAHELVHAVQDANFPLDNLRRATAADLDASLALTAVLEGDAVTHQSLYVERFLAQHLAQPSVAAEPRTPASDVPPSVARELFFPYTTGAEWLAAVRAAEGTAAVDNLLRNPPTTTASILHPDLASRHWSPTSVTLPDLAEALGAGWQRESGGTFGEFQLRNYLQLRLPGIPSATAAAGWDGDHYDVYRSRSESVAVFRVAFADAGEATEFAIAYETFLTTGGPRRTVQDGLTVTTANTGLTTVSFPVNGREATFVIGSSEAAATRLAILLMAG